MEELVNVASIVKDYDGVAAAHLRHAIGVLEATQEFLEVGRRSGVKLQVSHLRPNCPEAFEAVEKAVAKGVRARIDTIPRSTGHCTSKSRLILFIMALSDELFTAGEEGVRRALHTPQGRETIKKDAYIFAGDKSDKFIVLSEDPSLEGRSVKDIAAERGQDADECMLDLLGDDKQYVFWLGGPVRKDFSADGHADAIMRNPYVSVGTDEILGDPQEPYDWYELQRRGGFPIFMQMYRAKGVAVEEIVRRNTSMVARHFGIERRGELKTGHFADLAVIDLERYRFPSPQEIDVRKPLTMAEGIETVVVNGQVVVDAGKLNPVFPGRVLRKSK
jgi:N-acyl-D-aspartate/D-glutamate deacylase